MFFISVLFPVPCGFVIRNIQSPRGRMWTILILGVFLQWFLFGKGKRLMLIIAVIFTLIELGAAYFILTFVERKYVGWVMTAFTLTCLTYAHISRMMRNYGSWDLDIATGLMMLCIHLCGVGWDYVDGAADPSKLSTEQKKNALKECPTILELFSSGVCPTQCFAGPSSNLIDYKNFIYRRGIYTNVPSTFIPCMKRFLLGWVFVVFYVGIHKFFDSDQLRSPNFPNESFFKRVISYYTHSIFISSWLLFIQSSSIILGGQWQSRVLLLQVKLTTVKKMVSTNLIDSTPLSLRQWNWEYLLCGQLKDGITVVTCGLNVISTSE